MVYVKNTQSIKLYCIFELFNDVLIRKHSRIEAEFWNPKLISAFHLNIYIHATTQPALCKFRKLKKKKKIFREDVTCQTLTLNKQSFISKYTEICA